MFKVVEPTHTVISTFGRIRPIFLVKKDNQYMIVNELRHSREINLEDHKQLEYRYYENPTRLIEEITEIELKDFYERAACVICNEIHISYFLRNSSKEKKPVDIKSLKEELLRLEQLHGDLDISRSLDEINKKE